MNRPYFGTCLVGGRHPEGSEEWRECPLTLAARRANKALRAGGVGVDSGPSKVSQSAPDKSGTSDTLKRYRGRPRVTAAERRQKTRDRVRAYRAKRRTA
jgi:hypothetical protein